MFEDKIKTSPTVCLPNREAQTTKIRNTRQSDDGTKCRILPLVLLPNHHRLTCQTAAAHRLGTRDVIEDSQRKPVVSLSPNENVPQILTLLTVEGLTLSVGIAEVHS